MTSVLECSGPAELASVLGTIYGQSLLLLCVCVCIVGSDADLVIVSVIILYYSTGHSIGHPSQ